MLKHFFTPAVANWLIPFIVAAMTAIGSLYMANRNDHVQAATQNQQTQTELANRVTALEAHRADDESKLDHLTSQVDKLVEWALGHK